MVSRQRILWPRTSAAVGVVRGDRPALLKLVERTVPARWPLATWPYRLLNNLVLKYPDEGLIVSQITTLLIESLVVGTKLFPEAVERVL